MFPPGPFNPISRGFQFPGQQLPPASIYQSQFNGFNPARFHQTPPPPRGQSLPASVRQNQPRNGPYPPTTARRYGQYPVPPQHYDHRNNHRSKNKKHHKRRSISPNEIADANLYSEPEKNSRKSPETRSRSKSPALESPSKEDEKNSANENGNGKISQSNTPPADDEEQQQQAPTDEQKRESRSRKAKQHHHHHHHERFHNHFHQQSSPLHTDLPSHFKIHQQPLYNSYNQAFEEPVQRGDVYHKQAKRSTRLPPDVKQQSLPHEDDQQRQHPFNGFSQRPMHPSFIPYRPGYFTPPVPFQIPQPWSHTGGIPDPAEQEIQRLRHHIHSLEGELHKVQKRLNKITLNTPNETLGQDEHNRIHRRSKRNDMKSPRQTPVIVELNNTDVETSPKKHRHQQSEDENIKGQEINSHERSRSNENKNPPEEIRHQGPLPPPIQQGVLPSQGQRIRGHSNEPYQQILNIINSSFTQPEIPPNNDTQQNRSVEKILDAFERYYINTGKSPTTPIKVKFIPEESYRSTNRIVAPLT